MATVIRIAALVAVGYIGLVALMWHYQERIVFPAPRSPLPSPRALGFPDGERVELVTSDSVMITGWYLPPQGTAPNPSSSPGLLWFIGNMETVDVLAAAIRNLRPPGTGLLIINYRGYGDSEGRPSEDGVYRDAEAAWEFLAGRPEIDAARIGAYGRSIGSVPAIFVAANRPLRALVLDSPFTSGRDMARRHYRIFPRFLIRLEMNNLARIRALDIPVLIFHGTADFIIPFNMGKTLAQSTPRGEFVAIEGAGHNDTYILGGSAYRTRMHEFLDTHLTAR